MINDAHCHFFSPAFFSALARQRGHDAGDAICAELGWDSPGSAGALADRWVHELDTRSVNRAALIASVPGDESSVSEAVARHPSRLVGMFMVDPGSPDVIERITTAVGALGLRGVCLFPAMHHVPLDDDRVFRCVEAAATRAGVAVFTHCGVLSIGVRRKLGLASRFDVRLGDPLAVARLAHAYPDVPFIIPHFGAGFFREALMAADSAANIYFDTSSSNSWIRYTPGLTLDGVFRAALEVVGPSRLLFGTDSSFFPRGWQAGVYERQRTMVSELGVTEADASLIFGGNFDRLFRNDPVRTAS